ncbi:MAG: hypothetical protein HKP58_10190 [Desulfatitalea sp.]|nr:hypothetical protein [Desulfatitalea sp.]NNK00771.1 hypothetical protein [Desulfatitalea sp.]
MSRYPIAMIPYANMAPYETLGPPEGCHFVHMTPRNSIDALKAKTVWAAAVPVGGLARLAQDVVPVGNFGIGARGEVMSVLFFSRCPFERMAASHTVYLTAASASSVRLLYLLMGYRLGFDRLPELAVPGALADGELVIGDAALGWHHIFERGEKVKHYIHMTDLAALWQQHWQLPFVFARWVVRLDAPRAVIQSVEAWLARFAEREALLITQSVARVAGRLRLPDDYVLRYLKGIRRCLDNQDQAGQDRFLSEWQEHSRPARTCWFKG